MSQQAITRATTAALLTLSLSLPLRAQLRSSDLEGIERHRKSLEETRRREAPPILQSLDDPVESSQGITSLTGTWDFLEKEDADPNGRAEQPAETPVTLDISSTTLRERLSVLPKELTVPWSEELEAQVADYVVRHASYMGSIIGKWEYYDALFRPVFERYGIPGDVTALAIVESAMNPLALSSAGARGMWQFMPETARRFGLRVDNYVDERLDCRKSAEAAAQFLRNAYTAFGDWALAISSYNCGRANVERAIHLAGTTDYWSVHRFLPEETRGYMPAFVAALYSINFYKLHDIRIRNYSEPASATYKIYRQMTFREIADATGVPRGDLKRLNPQYQAGIIPANEKGFLLRLPQRFSKAFKEKMKK